MLGVIWRTDSKFEIQRQPKNVIDCTDSAFEASGLFAARHRGWVPILEFAAPHYDPDPRPILPRRIETADFRVGPARLANVVITTEVAYPVIVVRP